MKKRNDLAHLIRHFCTKCALNVITLEKEIAIFMNPSDKELFMEYAWRFVGTFYIWGGDDPSGFDCSGYAIEALKSIGLLPREGDWTADQLWNMFAEKQVLKPSEGCLVFWGNNAGDAIHVEICVNDKFSIGASGGGSQTTSVAKAIEHNAFIKMRPMVSRPMILGYVDPFKEV